MGAGRGLAHDEGTLRYFTSRGPSQPVLVNYWT